MERALDLPNYSDADYKHLETPASRQKLKWSKVNQSYVGGATRLTTIIFKETLCGSVAQGILHRYNLLSVR